MKANLNVEKLINDITNSIWFNCSYDNIKHCDEYPRENLITFELEIKPLNIFNYLSEDDAKELYNKLFVKDGRILRALKVFAERYNFEDVAIEHHNQFLGKGPILLLYKTKEQYIKEVIKEYCYYINCEAKRYDQKTVRIDNKGISKYFVSRDKYGGYVFPDDRILKEIKSIAIKNGYDDAIIINPIEIMLYKENIDINKK
jgi:hypothetical protein